MCECECVPVCVHECVLAELPLSSHGSGRVRILYRWPQDMQLETQRDVRWRLAGLEPRLCSQQSIRHPSPCPGGSLHLRCFHSPVWGGFSPLEAGEDSFIRPAGKQEPNRIIWDSVWEKSPLSVRLQASSIADLLNNKQTNKKPNKNQKQRKS